MINFENISEDYHNSLTKTFAKCYKFNRQYQMDLQSKNADVHGSIKNYNEKVKKYVKSKNAYNKRFGKLEDEDLDEFMMEIKEEMDEKIEALEESILSA